MKKMSFVFAVFAVLLVVASAEAQRRPYGGYGVGSGGAYRSGSINRGYRGYGTGYFDPSYLQQMMSLPEALYACQVTMGSDQVTDCEPIIKDIRIVERNAQAGNYNGKVFGTYHVFNGEDHFRPVDSTNRRITRRGAVGIGAIAGVAGGAAIGGAVGGRRGAAIGASVGAGGGALTGWWASRNSNDHSNCKVVNLVPTPSEQEVVVMTEPTTPVVAPPTTSTKLVRNRFAQATVRVYDGSTELIRLGPGEEKTIEIVAGARIWADAALENPLNGKIEWTPLQSGRGMDELPQGAGWLFGNPDTRPVL